MIWAMARDWDTQFTSWARPPGVTERQKMERAEKAIGDAIGASATLRSHRTRATTQGSYYNRTNVARESDVDIRVVPSDVFFTDWELVDDAARADETVRNALDARVGNFDHPYGYAEFKNDVETALVAHFGRAAVVRGDKAFDIHENTYRVESDCLAAYELRLYGRDSWGQITHREGIAFRTDKGDFIENFPEQQHAEGVAKHERTSQRFKKMVRILKNMRYEMEDEGVAAATPIPSFLVECLVWIVPDDRFARGTLYEDMRLVLAFLQVDLADERSDGWTEENGIKFLFHWRQSWTKGEAQRFVDAAWDYVGF
jgi:hypothetical protein